MLYEAKQGSKAYEFIKNTLEAEEKEYKAYMERVKQAIGFDFEKYSLTVACCESIRLPPFGFLQRNTKNSIRKFGEK